MFRSTKHVSPHRTNVKTKFCVRVGRIPVEISDNQIKLEFAAFGDIVEIRRPQNLAKRKPSQFAFIFYSSPQSVQAAIHAMDGKEVWETHITAGDGDVQDSYFTQDTGFITNEAFDVPKPPPLDFDSSLPEEHFYVKHKQDLKLRDQLFTVRVDDLHPDITKEMVEELFSSVAEVADVYFPVDLKHGCKSRGFAFIRFARQSDCDKAVRDLNGVYLGIGRNIVVSQPNCRTYFSQDESNS